MSRQYVPTMTAAALAVSLFAAALASAQVGSPGAPSIGESSDAEIDQANDPREVPSRTKPQAIPSTSKDAPADGTEPSDVAEDSAEAAKVRFEAFNGVTTDIAADGSIRIQDVKQRTDAAKTGLMAGDVIVEMDGHRLKSRTDTEFILKRNAVQPFHIVRIIRGADEMEVVLGRHVDFMGMMIVPDRGSRPLVHRVANESAAEKAGVHADDIVLGVSGRETATYKQFNDFAVPLVRKMSPGQELNLRLIRDAEEIEVAVIRPDEVDLPLLAAPEKPLPGDKPETTRRMVRPYAQRRPDHINVQNDTYYLDEYSGLTSPYAGGLGITPYIGFGLGNGGVNTGVFPTFPNAEAVVAVLHSSGEHIDNSTAGRKGPMVTDPTTQPIDPTTGVPTNPNVTPVAPTPTGRALPNQAAPVQGGAALQGGNGFQTGGVAAQGGTTQGVQNNLTQDPTMATTATNGMAGMGRSGFVLVASNGGTPFVRARVTGLAPGTYSLVVNEFGDCGDVAQNSAGSVVAVLAQFQAGDDGRAELEQPLLNAVAPSALLGRVVSVVPGSFLPTNAAPANGNNAGTGTNPEQGFLDSPDGNPLTDDPATPPPGATSTTQTNQAAVTQQANPGNAAAPVTAPGNRVSVACGVFGASSPNRFPTTN